MESISEICKAKGDMTVRNRMHSSFDKENHKQWDLFIVGILSIVFFILPFAKYTYRKTVYTISGLELLKGKVIMSGKVVLEPSKVLLALLIVNIIIILAAFIVSKLNTKRFGTTYIVLGALQVIINIVFSMQITGLLEKGKEVGVSYGSAFVLVIGFLIVAKGIWVLYKAKVLTALDFMVLPGLLYFVINNYIPMIGILIAFKKVDYSIGIFQSPWIGFENFKYLFATKDALMITRNTLLYNGVFILLGNILGIVVAISLAEIFSNRLRKIFQTSILLPHLISMVIVSYIVFGFLSNTSGWIKNTLLDNPNVNFYAEKFWWPYILTFVNTWKILGYASIIYLSSVVSIDKSLYEAAYVDGCSKWKQITKITLPMLKPTIITMVLIQVGRIFYSDFGLFYQVPMDSGALYSVTQTIDTYVYRSLLQTNNISMASAASTYQAVVGFLFVLIVNTIVRKVDRENALF